MDKIRLHTLASIPTTTLEVSRPNKPVLKSEVDPVHAMKARRKGGGTAPFILTLVPDKGERPTSDPSQFAVGKELWYPLNRSLSGSQRHLEDLEMRKIYCSCRASIPVKQVRSLVEYYIPAHKVQLFIGARGGAFA